MGAQLVGPVTAKESGDGFSEDNGFAWGFSCMQGWRNRMEDAHFCVPDLAACAAPGRDGSWSGTALFGVLDGHAGEQVALFCEQHLPPAVARGPAEDAASALTAAFFEMDEMLADSALFEESIGLVKALTGTHRSPKYSGCTAVVCCVQRDAIVVANAGDSRAVLCRRGKAIDLSEDHKPNLPQELARITRAGGCIVEQKTLGPTQYRVNGNLNLSRCIGDLVYKQQSDLPPEEQLICCTPDVKTFRRQADDEFIVLACDGVWDVLSSQEVVDFIRPQLARARSAEEASEAGVSPVLEDLLDHCLSPNLMQTRGLGGDNMTVLVVRLLQRDPAAEPGASPEMSEDVSEFQFARQGSAKLGSSWFCPYS